MPACCDRRRLGPAGYRRGRRARQTPGGAAARGNPALPLGSARAKLDQSEWLARRDRHDESARLAAEAATTFEELGAAPMLARARAILEGVATRSASGAEKQPSSSDLAGQ